MESPGAYLKRERELRGVSLVDLHEAIRVPIKSLEALEADRFELLPHSAFVKGYIKAYCRHLGLDETDTLLRYEMYLREVSLRVMPAREEELPEGIRGVQLNSKVTVGVLVAFGVLIILVLYLVRSLGGPGVSAPDQAQPLPSALVAPAVSSEAADAPMAHVKTRDSRLKQEVKAAAGGPFRHLLKVTATEDVWMEVTVDRGEPFEVLLKEGENVQWRVSEGIALVIGNAGGVTLVFDGQELPSPGGHGRVVRIKLPLSAPLDQDGVND